MKAFFCTFVIQIRNYSELKADPGSFFIFFPDVLHRPGLKDGGNSAVRKIVVKIMANSDCP